MPLHVLVINRQRTRSINARLLKQIVAAALTGLGVESAELGIRLVGAKEMARINEKFLQHEGSTDVITFNHEGDRGDAGPSVYGELFVCVDDAIQQAKQFQTTWQSEVVRYAVHGLLHLLGYDDIDAARRRKMKREENRLVRRLAARFSLAELSVPPRGKGVRPLSRQ
jgi:rRNA maturation RNase YbeY